jgi:mono/diheme cytochrome c family protein
MFLRTNNVLSAQCAALSGNPALRRILAACCLGVAIAGWFGNVMLAQEPRRNAEAQKLKNPESANAESIEAGKKLYQRYCASCHGPRGKGDGGMSLSGGTPSDLTDDAWDFGSTDGEIFVAIRDGVSSDMLAYKEKLNEKQIWQVVRYIRSLGPKEDK